MAVDRQEKCEAILRLIIDKVNTDPLKEKRFCFSADWGGDSATITWDGSHTHIGNYWDEPSAETWEMLIDHLYNQLLGGPGLTWANDSVNKEGTDGR
jgi:hypothetical protein